MGRRVSLASLATDRVDTVPGVTESMTQRLPLGLCYPNPYNREITDDLSDLAGIVERQLQSALGITLDAFLRLWPEDRDRFAGASAEAVVIINGNRRLAAAHKFGRSDLVVMTDDTLATSRAAVLRAALDENTNRQDLDPIEEARAVARIVGEYATAKEAAEAQGWSPSWVSHRGNLLKLHPELQDLVRRQAAGGEGISINVARRLGSTKGIQQMDLDQQKAALFAILQGDADAAAAKKQSRLDLKRRPDESASTAPSPIVAAPEPHAPAPVATVPPAPTPAPTAPTSEVPKSGTGSPAVERPAPQLQDSPTAVAAPVGSPSASEEEFSAENSPASPAVSTAADVPVDWTSPARVADLLISRLPKNHLRDVVTFLQLELEPAKAGK